MISEDFKLGFVEGCLAANCSKEQTEELYKIAHAAQIFDSNEEFKKGFAKVASNVDTEELSLMTKALLLERAVGVA